MALLRDMGTLTGSPAPFEPKDRSRFLQSLDTVANGLIRGVK